MINTYYIYFHRNPNTNDVFYVGLGLDRRAWDRSRGRNQHWINYVKKHGNPIVEIVHNDLTLEQATNKEQYYIKIYGRIGYEENGILVNKSEGGESGSRGIKWSKQSIEDRNQKLQGRIFTPEHSFKISLAKQNHPSYQNRKNNKQIYQKDLEGNIINKWNTIKEASVSLKLSEMYIIQCCKGKKEQYKGYKWEYKLN
mgnify:CR=1 FL=1|jgi:hypothetical protein